MNFRKFWYILVNALGQKASDDKSVADSVAIVRFLIVLSYIVTNIFIVAGVIRHW